MTEFRCFHCHEYGHLKRQCPHLSKPPAPERGGTDTPPGYDTPVPPRKPAWQIADAHEWAAKVREQMGWPEPGDDEGRLRALARTQVAEIRAREAASPQR